MQSKIVVNSDKSNQVHKWRSPTLGSFKINVDVVVPLNDQNFSIGMLIRNNTGAFIQGKVMKFAGSISAFEAETRGVLEAFSWIDSLGLHNIQVETDSRKTVAALESSEPNYLEVGNVLETCKDWLHGRSDVYVVHGRRQSNKAAHLLAHGSCLVGCSDVFYSPPYFLLETLLFDSTS